MRRSAKYLYIIGGSALSAERDPIGSIEKIHVESVENSSPPIVTIVTKNCGNLSLPVRSPSCFLIENSRKILIAGGCTGPNEHTDRLSLLEIENENSRILEKTLMEDLKIGASCSGFDSQTQGNFKPLFGGFEAHSCLDDIQIIDTSTWKCNNLAKKLLPKIKNSTVLEVKHREFLMFGGWEDEQRTTKAIRRITFNEDFSEYTVEFSGFLPYPVEGHSMVRIDSCVYLIGGFDGCFVLDSIIKYDLETKTSEILPKILAEKRENHVSAVLSDGRFLTVAGGWNSKNALDDVEVFEIQKDSGEVKFKRYEVQGKLLTARNRPAGVAV